MTQSTSTRLLPIAIDAAEPTFVRRLIDEKEMPALASLLRDGTWLRVKSSAYVGGGAVWPTFMSGQSPQVHGVYGEWLWDAGTMSLSRYHGNDLDPFWKELVGGGTPSVSLTFHSCRRLAWRCQIGLSYEIEFALVADAQVSSEPFGQNASRVTRGLNGKVEQ